MYDLRRNKILERLDEEALRRITAGGVLNDTLAFNRIWCRRGCGLVLPADRFKELYSHARCSASECCNVSTDLFIGGSTNGCLRRHTSY